MADAGTQSGGPSLPLFDPKKVYLVKGKTLNDIVSTVKRSRPRVVLGSGLSIASETDQGTFLAPSGGTIDLVVCINGLPVTKTFLLAK